MRIIFKKHNFKIRKRALLFSLFFLFFIAKCQVIIRHSDNKKLDSIIIDRNNEKITIKKKDISLFVMKNQDKVYFNNKLMDFVIANDSLIFFDKVIDIEKIEIKSIKTGNRRERIIKSNKMVDYIKIVPNNTFATLIKLNTSKKAYLKSIIFLLEPLLYNPEAKGKVKIEILSNVNELPNESQPILVFEKDFGAATKKQWEILLPKIIELPKEGLFVTLHHSNSSKNSLTLRLNPNLPLFLFYPQNSKWERINNGLNYQLKILQ